MFEAACVTPAALRWIEATESARVLNAFDRACNLVNQDGEIITLIAPGVGMNPFAVRLAAAPAPFRGITGDTSVRVKSNRLSLNRMQVRVDGAEVWQPRPDWGAVRAAFETDPSRVESLAAMADEIGRDGSLLGLISYRAVERIQSDLGEFGNALFDRARRPAAELVHGLHARSEAECLRGARWLAGLGGGLTPAGDDFIVGVLLAAWAGLYGPGAETLGPAIAQAAAPLTTRLSAAYLRAAARGECMERWHELFHAICDGDESLVRLEIGDLLEVGHTSGADALAGFVARETIFARAG